MLYFKNVCVYMYSLLVISNEIRLANVIIKRRKKRIDMFFFFSSFSTSTSLIINLLTITKEKYLFVGNPSKPLVFTKSITCLYTKKKTNYIFRSLMSNVEELIYRYNSSVSTEVLIKYNNRC